MTTKKRKRTKYFSAYSERSFKPTTIPARRIGLLNLLEFDIIDCVIVNGYHWFTIEQVSSHFPKSNIGKKFWTMEHCGLLYHKEVEVAGDGTFSMQRHYHVSDLGFLAFDQSLRCMDAYNLIEDCVALH